MRTKVFWCRLVIVLAVAAVPATPTGSCLGGWAGRDFAFSFMENLWNYWREPQINNEVQVTALQDNTKVTVKMPSLNFIYEGTLKSGETRRVTLPVNAVIHKTRRSRKTVQITASADVTVSYLNFQKLSADTSVAYPMTEWGTEYFIFTPPVGPKGFLKEFSVTNGKDTNQIEVFPQGKVTFEGHSYNVGSRMVINLQPYETVQMMSRDVLSGTRVSSQHPVGVSAGQNCAGGFNKCDHVFEQLLPVTRWGSRFIVPSLKFQTRFDSVYVQASQPTQIRVQNGNHQDRLELTRGEVKEIHLSYPGSLSIQADHGIQVLMLYNGDKKLNYDPFLINILPTDRFCSSYFLQGQKGFKNTGLIVAKTNSLTELRMDGAGLVHNMVWRKVVGTEYSWAQLSEQNSPNTRHIESTSGTPFGLYSIGVKLQNGYGSLAGCGQPGIVSLSCSNVKCGANQVCQMKGGLPSCESQGSSLRGWAGRDFAFSLMENLWRYKEPQTNNEVQVTALQDNTKVTVKMPSLNFIYEGTLKSGETRRVTLPVNAEIDKTRRSRKTVQITASADVTVSYLNFQRLSADTSVAYPMTEWGTEYLIFTPPVGPKGFLKEFSVTNGKDTNQIEVFPQGKVTFEGHSYNVGSRMVINLQPYETVQMMSRDVLSGTRVSSQHPVGVSAGQNCAGRFNKCDHVFEQLLPVTRWGSRFIVPSLKFQTRFDSVYVQASQPTQIRVQNGNHQDRLELTRGEVKEIHLSYPGSLSIQADHGIQVLMLYNGDKKLNYDPFLINILPTDRFRSSYFLQGQKGFKNTGLIVAKTNSLTELRMDGAGLVHNMVWRKVVGTEYSWAQLTEQNSPNTRHIESTSRTPFGLYSIGVKFQNGYGSLAGCGRPGIVSLSCSNVKCGANQVCQMKGGLPSCESQGIVSLSCSHVKCGANQVCQMKGGLPSCQSQATTMTEWSTAISTPTKSFTVTNGKENNNQMQIFLTGKVTYGGREYNAGSRLVIDLQPNQSVHIQSPDMLTGTRVVSKYRVTFPPMGIVSLSCSDVKCGANQVCQMKGGLPSCESQATTVTEWRTAISTPTNSFTVTNGNENNNQMQIFLTGEVTYGGRKYNAGSRLVIDLQPNQSVHIQSPDMLTGTRVVSQHRVSILIMVQS